MVKVDPCRNETLLVSFFSFYFLPKSLSVELYEPCDHFDKINVSGNTSEIPKLNSLASFPGRSSYGLGTRLKLVCPSNTNF